MTLTQISWQRIMCLLTLALGGLAAVAGLFWTPPGEFPVSSDLYGQGLYRRDTPFVAGGAQGSDVLTLIVVVPVTLWALVGHPDVKRLVVLAAAQSWFLYLNLSLAFGSVAFNEVFPVYTLLIPVATVGLALCLHRLENLACPSWLPGFLAACGVVTGAAWTLLLWAEMTSGSFPPDSYYTVRTTYALDLGVIAPGCLASALALRKDWPWGIALALPLLAIAGLLLPMMVAQTLMQLRAGVAFGPEAAAPLIGFSLVSGGAPFSSGGWQDAAPAQSNDRVAGATDQDRAGPPAGRHRRRAHAGPRRSGQARTQPCAERPISIS
jgi:hypothetical protein